MIVSPSDEFCFLVCKEMKADVSLCVDWAWNYGSCL